MVPSITAVQIGKTRKPRRKTATPRTASRAKSDHVTVMAVNVASVYSAASGPTRLPASMQSRATLSNL